MSAANLEKKKSSGLNFLNRAMRTTKNTPLKMPLAFGRVIAILVDDYAIQMATSARFWNRSRLIDVTKIYIPSTLSEPQKRREFIGYEINQYIREHKRPFTRYVLGVDGEDTVVRILNFPRLPRKELERAIYWEGNKVTPFGLDNAYYGYHRLEKSSEAQSETLNVCLIAASKKDINNRLSELGDVISPSAVRYDLEAIGRLLEFIDGYSPDQTYILINIKRNYTEISFYRMGQLEFKHISSLGSQAIEKTRSPEPRRFNAFAESLAQEIQNILDFYVAQFGRRATDIAYIYGDLSYSEELIARLTAKFGIEFKRFPLNFRKKSQTDNFSAFDQTPVALKAVALSYCGEGMIDFSPPPLREARAKRKCRAFAIPALGFIALGLMSIWITMKSDLDMDRYLLETANGEIAEFQNSPAYIMYGRLQQRLESDSLMLKNLRAQPTYLHLNLKELSLLTPQQIKLQSFELENGGNGCGLTLEGRAYSMGTPPEMSLAEYVARLEASPFYEKVRLKKYAKKAEAGQFIIDFLISAEAII
jgi:hypothetical protein